MSQSLYPAKVPINMIEPLSGLEKKLPIIPLDFLHELVNGAVHRHALELEMPRGGLGLYGERQQHAEEQQ